jgi:hypothetical protein
MHQKRRISLVRPLDMALLIHEVWEQPDGSGQTLPGLCLAGPDGDGFRSLLEQGSRLVTTFEASSHFEAMFMYYELVGYGEYVNEEAWSHQPYGNEEAVRQKTGTRPNAALII